MAANAPMGLSGRWTLFSAPSYLNPLNPYHSFETLSIIIISALCFRNYITKSSSHLPQQVERSSRPIIKPGPVFNTKCLPTTIHRLFTRLTGWR